jgi:hypothetical protein
LPDLREDFKGEHSTAKGLLGVIIFAEGLPSALEHAQIPLFRSQEKSSDESWCGVTKKKSMEVSLNI